MSKVTFKVFLLWFATNETIFKEKCINFNEWIKVPQEGEFLKSCLYFIFKKYVIKILKYTFSIIKWKLISKNKYI